MNRKIKIKSSDISAEAELNDSRTSELILESLPIEAEANTWGEEVYFEIPVTSELDGTAKEFVESGDKIKPASSVNIIGKIIGDAKVFKKTKDGME
ncbi:MAG: hypothetical protein A3C43_01170 [Candidatus Schekmanbacteria bacterium RIFCSPHIGHO2_02_FULL_38_11]|uniref:Cyclophilin TM1367-like domain-containing protein n=1 Tax=Candidatus Schekmanbacteria bacterium RIFCSPLOWO2_12_FULL_38_15 TaxID=1817883 RepID=A0A1F7SGK1_9BACT|nr:MAG: hypothetical protein A2043_07665 [Candidatus Schekmanbacteria bacterium GWA2_38_9]OGL52714.1 MAG: hypothetical protein A3C43_01170 [Candidatus Schekmanbacteria bacterium RIFCSPHIGHO2_02_FULL_38_11]OGL52885.1 MAG: hypothetical protein A3G31_00490 [Candidatus Schekmanbacteria bacterium RIFCSPLOWO2_12_FULL_38_15]